jgi:hypothetical protein
VEPDPGHLSTEEFAEWWKTTGEYELHQIVYWRWDPIGVADQFPYNADEYDQYPPQIVGALRRAESRDELVSLLRGFEHHQMGLLPRDGTERLDEIASFLRAWFEHSQKSWQEFGPVRR